MGYLIDSNVLIDYVAERFNVQQLASLDKIFDEELNISIISKIETLAFNSSIEEDDEMQKFLMLANIYQLNDAIVDETIAIRKTVKLKIPDAVIAATALVNNLTLITRNLADFRRVERLNVVNPHEF